MTINKQSALVDIQQASEVLARGFRLPFSDFTSTNTDGSYTNKRFVLWAAGPHWKWAFLVTQRTPYTATTYDCFLTDDTGVMHAQVLGVAPGAGGSANFDFMLEFATPYLRPIDDRSSVWPTYEQVRHEIEGQRDINTKYATTTAGMLERTANATGCGVDVFFSSENTRVDGKCYKILLMRVIDDHGRDDMVTTVFNTKPADARRPDHAPSIVSPLFRSAVRLYTARAYPQMLDVFSGPDAEEWLYMYGSRPYPAEASCFCWTKPKLRAKDKTSPAIYDDRFVPFSVYKVVGDSDDEHGKRYFDVVSASGEIVRRPSHNFVLIPGKHENVRLE